MDIRIKNNKGIFEVTTNDNTNIETFRDVKVYNNPERSRSKYIVIGFKDSIKYAFKEFADNVFYG